MSEISVIARKPIFSAVLFKVEECTLKQKNGKTNIHHNAIRRPTVSVFPVDNSYKLYLVSQYRYLLQKTTLEATAGFIHKGESSLEAAKRELKEETGLVAKEWKELSVVETSASVFNGQYHIFLAKDLKLKETDFDEDEEITLVKISLEDAIRKVIDGEINHASSMIGILLIDRLKKEKKL